MPISNRRNMGHNRRLPEYNRKNVEHNRRFLESNRRLVKYNPNVRFTLHSSPFLHNFISINRLAGEEYSFTLHPLFTHTNIYHSISYLQKVKSEECFCIFSVKNISRPLQHPTKSNYWLKVHHFLANNNKKN